MKAAFVPVGQGRATLGNWFRKLKNDAANAKAALSGDSTSNGETGPSPYLYARIAGISYQSVTPPKFVHTAPGEGLSGMTADTSHFIDGGNSGMTLAQYLSDYDANVTTAKSLRWMIAQAPDLIVLSWGINDVRLGATTKAQLIARLNTLVGILRTALPATDLVLRVPNSLGTTNTGGFNYVQDAIGTINPAGLAQTYTNLLRTAYYAVQEAWPNVVLADAQAAVFGTTSQAVAAGTLLGDQLHPTQGGQYELVDWLVRNIIGYYPAKSLTTAATITAKALSQYAPWTVDAAVLDDPASFVQLGSFPYVGQGSGYLDVSLATAGLLTNYDIMRLPDGQVVQFPASSVTFSQNGPTTRILWSSIPVTAVTQGSVRFYRQAVTGDTAVNPVLVDPSWRYKRVGRVVSGTTTSLVVKAFSATADRATEPASDWAGVMSAGDKVYVEGAGATPATLSAGQFAVSSSNLSLTGLSGVDYSTLVGRIVVIVGTHAAAIAGPQGVQGPAGGIAGVATSGRWNIPALTGPISAGAGAVGTDYALPFVLLNAGQVDQLMAQVSTAVAGSAFRLGLRSSTNLLPDALLLDAGTFDASTTGTKISATLTATSLTAGNLYWLTIWLTGSAAANLTTINGISPLINGRNVAGEFFTAYSTSRGTTDGALPSAWGTTYTPAGWGALVRAHIV
jgi:hypothetical protein